MPRGVYDRAKAKPRSVGSKAKPLKLDISGFLGKIQGKIDSPQLSPGAAKIARSVPNRLRKAAETYEARNKTYGDNYKNFGKVMLALFPNGLPPMNDDLWVKLGIIVQCASKLGRYCENLTRQGGHVDSAHDLGVYAIMLEEVTDKE